MYVSVIPEVDVNELIRPVTRNPTDDEKPKISLQLIRSYPEMNRSLSDCDAIVST
jgi:hypothetical protein